MVLFCFLLLTFRAKKVQAIRFTVVAEITFCSNRYDNLFCGAVTLFYFNKPTLLK